MPTTEPIKFENDDAAYDAWMVHHEGYLLTRPRAGQYWLHDHTCPALLNFRERRSMTAKPRYWAERRRELKEWAERQPGYVLHICSRCG